METPSSHCREESQFHVFPNLKPCGSNTGGAEGHRGPTLPEKPSPSSHTPCDLPNGWAPASIGLPPAKKPVSWRRPSVVGAGLQNLGNTCYANAALQCLTYTPPLAGYMLSQEHSRSCGRQPFCVLCALQAHVTRALCRPGDVIRPPPKLLAAFHTHRQEDAHEFLMFTLDAMQQACLREDKPSEPQAQDATLIRQIFGGYWRSQIQCLHCQGVSSTLDPYLDISLDIRAAQSVSQALQHLVKPEQLDGENAYRCSTCLDKVPASKTLTLHTCSKVLMLVLKRFCHFTGSKLAKEVQYPERLDMRRYVSGQNGGSLTYVLYAVLVHAGWNCHSGHYFCYIKAGNGQWYKMDDAKVTASDATSALSQHAYVLFYIQKSELERDRGSEPGAGESTSLQADHAGTAAAQGGPETDPDIEVPQLEDHVEETPPPAITLDQWRFLQESHRPKSEFNLRKLEFALPPDTVLIHQSKYRDEMGKDHREPNIYRLNSSARDIPPQSATAINRVPCLPGRARATKRKNKKGQRSQEAVQGSHYRP
ncbi:ubiquitin carboxyl-terminal hydrolase 17-like protein 6 [Panthera onca]